VEGLDVSAKSIGHWSDNFGHVERPPSLQGRPRALNAAALADVNELVALLEITEWLAIYHDQPIYTSSLHHTLQDIGIIYEVMRRVAAERDDIARAIQSQSTCRARKHKLSEVSSFL
jgi:hypothetical protein